MATDLLAKRTPAAPSETYEAFPAVVEPSFLNAGFNFAKVSKVVPLRIPSSYETTISLTFSSPSLTIVFTGIISSLYKPNS